MKRKKKEKVKKIQKKPKEFKPTPSMELFLEAFLDPDSPRTKSGCARTAGLDENIYWKWMKKHKKAFSDWFWENTKNCSKMIMGQLDRVGLRKCEDDYRYFEKMYDLYHGISQKAENNLNIAVTATQTQSATQSLSEALNGISEDKRKNTLLHLRDAINAAEGGGGEGAKEE